MSYQKRIFLLMFVDSAIVLFAIYISYLLISPTGNLLDPILIVSSLALLISHHIFSYVYKLYKRAWEYASVGELIAIAKAVTYSVLSTGLIQLVLFSEVYHRTLVITWMMHILCIGGSRFSWRMYRDTLLRKVGMHTSPKEKKRTLIIGAGAAGTMVARQLQHNKQAELEPVAFIDDDLSKQKLQIMDLPVVGGVSSIQEMVERLHIENIVIAIPSLDKRRLNKIFEECRKTKAKTKMMPMIEDLMLGKVTVNQIRDVEVEDLLGREPVELDTEHIAGYIYNQVVLVTGAGGSIGSEICRQISHFSPRKVILLGHGENSIYAIDMELKEDYGAEIEYVTEIADIQDRAKMLAIMDRHRPQVIFHAAAHKHVPLMERNPEEAVKNNIIGTKHVAEAADYAGVNTFVMISTDKAVNPTSVMGASKRLAEMIIQDLAKRSMTKFVAVRFGNVLGSRGSVIPFFTQQIKKGGPVTVTHPEMVRYFMTIPEASRLVIQAGALARGGEIFVLDMGEPVKIVDLARNLIKLSGYSLEEIEIKFTGIRPGEKLFEELLDEKEIHPEQVFPKIYIGRSRPVDLAAVYRLLEEYNRLDRFSLKEQILDIANDRHTSVEQFIAATVN